MGIAVLLLEARGSLCSCTALAPTSSASPSTRCPAPPFHPFRSLLPLPLPVPPSPCSAYIFSRYNKAPAGAGYSTPTFDWVAVQLYESFSHALYNTTVRGQTAADYLTAYIPTLSDSHWDVQFGSYPGVKWPSQTVSLNRTQVVIGLANAWTDGSRAILIMPEEVGAAYTRLQAKGQAPRGFAFWVSACRVACRFAVGAAAVKRLPVVAVNCAAKGRCGASRSFAVPCPALLCSTCRTSATRAQWCPAPLGRRCTWRQGSTHSCTRGRRLAHAASGCSTR